MRFLGSTWRTDAGTHTSRSPARPTPDGRRYATDGDGDQIADPWNSYDAAHAAARYLVDLGGREDRHTAAGRYNAGPNNPNPHAGLAYADQASEWPPATAPSAADAPTGDVTHDAEPGPTLGAVAVADPTGRGGCITPRTAHLVGQIETAHGSLPMWCFAPDPATPPATTPKAAPATSPSEPSAVTPLPPNAPTAGTSRTGSPPTPTPSTSTTSFWDGLISTGPTGAATTAAASTTPTAPPAALRPHHISVAA